MEPAAFLAGIEGDGRQVEAYKNFGQLHRQESLLLWSRWGRFGHGFSGSTYSCLIASARVPKALKQPGWDVRIEGHRPGFSESYADGKRKVSYEAIASEGVVPLLHLRLAVDRYPDDFVFAEEFLLLFDLHRGKDGNWYLVDEAGDDYLAIEIQPDAVLAQTGLVRRYQAVKQMALELTIDSDVADDGLESLGEQRHELQTVDSCFSYFRGPLMGHERWYSRLVGKRILTPPPIEDCGLWPYEAERQYESFTIDVDEMGRPLEYSSNPDGLANYFGNNPDAPQYVTPVTFRKDVLEKYYRSHDKYTVEDGYVRRGGFWGLRMDNEDPKHVIVMLGDLGRDLPLSEQKYWKSFNVPHRGKFSETAFRRGFLGQFADAAALDLQFKRLYPEVNDAWRAAFGWQLFLDLNDDAYLIDQVRVLPNDQQGLFDQQVIGLAKLLVDSLNEQELVAAAGPGPDDEKGISKLGRYLHSADLPTSDSIIDCLRELQAIRSSGAAHRKGKQYEKIRAAAASTDRRLWWADLLEQSIKSLEQLRIFARGRNAGQ
jgi:hypothetical protein